MKRNLTAAQIAAFDNALLYLRTTNPAGGCETPFKGPSVLADDGLLGKRIDGLSLQQIMDAAPALKKKSRANISD